MKKVIAVIAVVASSLAYAGLVQTRPSSCIDLGISGSPSGYAQCSGTLQGFRNSTDATAGAKFQINTTSPAPFQFSAVSGGRRYACNGKASMAGLAAALVDLGPNAYFTLRILPSGECEYVIIDNASSFLP